MVNVPTHEPPAIPSWTTRGSRTPLWENLRYTYVIRWNATLSQTRIQQLAEARQMHRFTPEGLDLTFSYSNSMWFWTQLLIGQMFTLFFS